MRRKKIPKHVWLRYDIQPPVFECKNCNERRICQLPATIEDFVLQGYAFVESHKFCKPSKTQGEQ